MLADICIYLGAIFCNLIIVICYNEISNHLKIKNYFFFIVSILISSYLTYLVSIYFYSYHRLLINSVIFLILNYIIYKEDLKSNLLKTLLIYLMVIITEIVLSILTYFLDVASLQEYDKFYLFKLFFSILNMMVVCFIFKIKQIKIFFTEIVYKQNKNKIYNFSLFLLYIVAIVIAFRGIIIRSKADYLINIVLVILFLTFVAIVFYQSYKEKEAEKKQEVLLNFMKKYEKLIDRDRICRHEMLNNLLILKSVYKTEEINYENVLEKIISEYLNNENFNYYKISQMPTGLKGLLYYKIYDMEELNINIIFNISPVLAKKLNKFSESMYLDISKILGILLDNAKESAMKTKEKEVVIDIYEEKGKIIIYIENSCKSIVKINKIKEKGYSDKGKGRGYGLYIVEKILEKNKGLKLFQNCTAKRFVSKIIIDKKSS